MSKVIVFGASATETWEPIYQEAILLGKKLAMYGHEVWNGGYFGLMGAVSRGAFSKGGVVVGVTSKTFSFRSGENPWLSKTIDIGKENAAKKFTDLIIDKSKIHNPIFYS